jgi:hypothetical protein
MQAHGFFRKEEKFFWGKMKKPFTSCIYAWYTSKVGVCVEPWAAA